MQNQAMQAYADLSKDQLLKLTGIFFGYVFVHYGIWFTETVRKEGLERAVDLEPGVLDAYFPAAMKRLAPHLGIKMNGNIPEALINKNKEDLVTLIGDLAKTWVAGDGLWFQAVEGCSGMNAAKQINDTCWSRFAHLEAHKILTFLGAEAGGGLQALEQALRFRVYSTINAHLLSWNSDGSLLFTITECRVQSSRRRKNMDDYPCKSAGLVEYGQFALGVDKRIQIDCVRCPPDVLNPGEFCSWRFTIG